MIVGANPLLLKSSFTPDQLNLIAWYDPSDLSTLWQDTSATTPITADGQTVARMDDKSGNGYHMVQATASKRPLYKTAGGFSWLDFDGADDGMDVSSPRALAVSMPTTWTACAGSYIDSTANAPSIVDSDDETGTRYAQQLRVGGGPDIILIVFNTANGNFADSTGTVSPATEYVFTSSRRTTEIEAYLDGITNGPTATTGTPRSGNFGLALGKRVFATTTPGFQYLNGRIYGVVLTDGDLSVSAQTKLEKWMADKSGVSL